MQPATKARTTIWAISPLRSGAMPPRPPSYREKRENIA